MIGFNEKTRHHAGRARIIDDRVVLEYLHDPKVEIPISNIKLIGEYTTENGPQLDDYFMVFYYSDNSYAVISMYAENLNEMIDELAVIMKTKLDSHLVNSTVWNSNILWPSKSKGERLWVVVKAKPKGIIESIKMLFGMEKLQVELTEVANGYL